MGKGEVGEKEKKGERGKEENLFFFLSKNRNSKRGGGGGLTSPRPRPPAAWGCRL